MAKPQNVRCPECDGPMVSRKNKSDGSRFWGCAKYPKCKGTRDSMGDSAQERTGRLGFDEQPRRWDR